MGKAFVCGGQMIKYKCRVLFLFGIHRVYNTKKEVFVVFMQLNLDE